MLLVTISKPECFATMAAIVDIIASPNVGCIAIAAEHPIGKLILEAPYTSTADVASSLFPFLPVRLLMQDQFRSDERIGKVTAPLLVMHGEHDPGIAIRFGERLFALAREPKRFVRFPQGGHEDLDDHGAIAVVNNRLDPCAYW